MLRPGVQEPFFTQVIVAERMTPKWSMLTCAQVSFTLSWSGVHGVGQLSWPKRVDFGMQKFSLASLGSAHRRAFLPHGHTVAAATQTLLKLSGIPSAPKSSTSQCFSAAEHSHSVWRSAVGRQRSSPGQVPALRPQGQEALAATQTSRSETQLPLVPKS